MAVGIVNRSTANWRSSILGVVAFLLVAGSLRAQSGGGYVVRRSSVDGGGGRISGGSYVLNGTIGQPDTGTLSGGLYNMTGGFWSNAAPVADPPTTAPSPHNRRKNRYLSFTPGNTGKSVAFRVRKTTAPGGSCWVQTPVQTGNDQYTARCDAAPVFRIWTEPVVHVGDCEIVPVADYEIYANATGPAEVPTPLAVSTIALPALNGKLWGDTVGINNGLEWTPPNQFTNVQDVLAILAFITNAGIKPHFTAANLQAVSSTDSCLNAFVNTSDVLIVVRATAGDSYGPPSSTKLLDPALCPVCP